jgi:hypothetical protein
MLAALALIVIVRRAPELVIGAVPARIALELRLTRFRRHRLREPDECRQCCHSWASHPYLLIPFIFNDEG